MRWAIPLWTILLLSAGCGPASRPTGEVWRDGAPPLEDATAARIREAVHQPGARATLVNVWATWCAPCREEFPEMLRIHRQYRDRGLRLVLVSADVPDSSELARRFLEAQGVDFTTYLKREKDMEFIDGLDPRWSGALPATFVYDANGRLRSFHEGKTTAAEFESLVVSAMNPDDTRGKETVR
jgi:thiol-disulfide isomerase/thioredoxin